MAVSAHANLQMCLTLESRDSEAVKLQEMFSESSQVSQGLLLGENMPGAGKETQGSSWLVAID